MKIIDKVVAYIYRINNGKGEVLVFDHDGPRDDPKVNPQVPAGTVLENESPEVGVLREVFEETGLKFNKPLNYLGTQKFVREDLNEIHRRHFFEFYTEGLEETWTHQVSSGDEDEGMIFHYYWLPLNVAREKLVAGMGDELPDLLA